MSSNRNRRQRCVRLPHVENEPAEVEAVHRHARWNEPTADTPPAPRWADFEGQNRTGTADYPSTPWCTEKCPWFMIGGIVQARARLAGQKKPKYVNRCMYPGRRYPDLTERPNWCWPAYILVLSGQGDVLRSTEKDGER